MSVISLAASRPVGAFLRAAFAAGLLALTGCATHYVDGGLKDVSPAQMSRPARPAAAQLVFEFQTKGVANGRATERVKPMVVESIKATGLFSQVDDNPGPGKALLSVTLNNVSLTDDAYAKGFMTGLTFGAAGSQVTDGYICTVSYMAPGQAQPVVKTARHVIHTTLGASGAPANAYKAASIEDALRTMVRQVVAAALNDLSHDAAFARAAP